MKSPRERFREDPAAVRGLQDLADNSGVLHSIDMARLQLAHRYSEDTSPTCSLNHYRMQGVHDFVKLWLSLGDKTEPAKRDSTDQLLDPDVIPPLKPKK